MTQYPALTLAVPVSLAWTSPLLALPSILVCVVGGAGSVIWEKDTLEE